ncbi:MAG: hypothetical protein Ta2E_08940 [Mycoplasmoidaceae bacterium]|nr:MAG: hypothetical protein Ta2E_08940 [Mycoplasmoidaceae bacterium]
MFSSKPGIKDEESLKSENWKELWLWRWLEEPVWRKRWRFLDPEIVKENLNVELSFREITKGIQERILDIYEEVIVYKKKFIGKKAAIRLKGMIREDSRC